MTSAQPTSPVQGHDSHGPSRFLTEAAVSVSVLSPGAVQVRDRRMAPRKTCVPSASGTNPPPPSTMLPPAAPIRPRSSRTVSGSSTADHPAGNSMTAPASRVNDCNRGWRPDPHGDSGDGEHRSEKNARAVPRIPHLVSPVVCARRSVTAALLSDNTPGTTIPSGPFVAAAGSAPVRVRGPGSSGFHPLGLGCLPAGSVVQLSQVVPRSHWAERGRSANTMWSWTACWTSSGSSRWSG